MTATFGDFLGPAGEHIAAAAAFRGDLAQDVRDDAIAQLGRLIPALARYFGDLPLPEDPDRGGRLQPSPAAQAAAGARVAMRRAARSLRHGAPATAGAHPVVRHLSAAADCLGAGRDLLQTHFTTGPSGARPGSSTWAPAVTSGPVTAALLSELAGHARTLAPWAAQLTMTGSAGPGMPAPERLILQSAIQGLWITSAAVEAAQRDHHPAASAHRTLAAIPASIPPARRPPGDGEQVPQLCEGITITAERLRHTALTPARTVRWSPAATSATWRRSALAAAITSHASETILRILAERASQLHLDPAIQAQLHDAASAMSHAWPASRAVTCQWDILSTGAHHGTRATAAADAADLALRTGRLAHASPHWTPGDASGIRGPADLAPTADAITAVVAALHHAADATTRTAVADQQAVRTAAADKRLYLPTCLAPDKEDIPYRYTAAPRTRTRELLRTYDTAVSAGAYVTQILEDLGAAIAAPATMPSVRRSLAQANASRRETEDISRRQAQAGAPPDAPLPAGQTESLLHDLQITDPAMLLRAAAIDQARHDLLAEATAKSRRRDTATVALPQSMRKEPGRAASVAGKDFPRPRPTARTAGDPERREGSSTTSIRSGTPAHHQVPPAGPSAMTPPTAISWPPPNAGGHVFRHRRRLWCRS